MNRVKTFDSTGIAPGGKLFAGDLNAIQDAAAAITDFAQNISVASLLVGDGSLSLAKFGAGEGSFSGAFRSTGLLRGLGGIIAGTFTTAQRDAIALNVGLAPYGTIILNSTTNQYEWNKGTDAARNWQPIGPLEATTTANTNRAGTLALRPAAGTVNPGTLYFATDNGHVYRSDGAAWTLMSSRAGAEYDYKQITADINVPNTAVSEATAQTLITGNSITTDGDRVKVEGRISSSVFAGGSGYVNVALMVVRDATNLGFAYFPNQASGGGESGPHFIEVFDTPPAGAHTYLLKFFSVGGATPTETIRAGTGGAGTRVPGFLRVTRA